MRAPSVSEPFIWESTPTGDYRAFVPWFHHISNMRIPPEAELVGPGVIKNVTPPKGWNAPKCLDSKPALDS
jgi:hypothetical protein